MALLGGLEDPGVVCLAEPDVMRELTAVHVQQPVALGSARFAGCALQRLTRDL
jgi:hypothetical protein